MPRSGPKKRRRAFESPLATRRRVGDHVTRDNPNAAGLAGSSRRLRDYTEASRNRPAAAADSPFGLGRRCGPRLFLGLRRGIQSELAVVRATEIRVDSGGLAGTLSSL